MTKDKDPVDGIPRVRVTEERPASLSEPLPREKLPKDLQKIVDKEDDLWDTIYEGQYDLRDLSSALSSLHVRHPPEQQIPPTRAYDMPPTRIEYER
jgi:hypothetical protein